MKILILSTKIPYPPKDGGAIATLNLAKGLVNSGIDVSMLSFNTKKHFYPLEKIPDVIRNSIEIFAIEHDTKIKPFKAIINLFFSREPYIAERFRSKAFAEKLTSLLSANDYNLIQLEGPYFAQYVPLIKKFSSGVLALRAHNIEHEIWQRRAENEAFLPLRLYLKNLSKRIKKLEQKLIENIDLLIPISNRDSRILLGYNPGLRNITIPGGIDISEYTLKPGHLNGDLFFIGALDWAPNREGLEWFIKNYFSHVLEKKPDLKFHIAGRNAPDGLLKVIAHPNIIYHGEVEDAQDYMNEHGIMLVPLLSGSGIRIKLLEGMALGKCIVSTSIGAEGIPLENGIHLLLADDGKTFADNILSLIDDQDLVIRVSASARKLIEEKFDTFAIANELGDYYKKLA